MPRKPTEEELGIINKYFAKREFSADDLRVIECKGAQAGVMTAYFSYLTPKSIQNFVMDTTAKMRNGSSPTIAYYLNHDRVSRLPLGALFDAKEVGEEKELEFHNKVFLPLNYSTGDVTADDYIKSVEFGMSEQVSVGFLSNKQICRLCHQDIRSSKCPHWPGGRYNMGTEEEPRFEICTYDVDDAKLVEQSAAWRGALPGARVLSTGEGSEQSQTEGRTQNIKDFPEGSLLKFNCSGQGSIELVQDLDIENLNAEGGILMQKNSGGAQTETQSEAAKIVIQNLTEENVQLHEKCGQAEADMADKDLMIAGLKQELAETNAALAVQKAIADSYLAEVRGEIHKLSVGIDASTYSKENLDTILDKLSLEELQAQRSDLRMKLSKVVATGRSTSTEAVEIPRTLENYIDKSVYRTRR